MFIALQETPALQLHSDDNVAIALRPLSAGSGITAAGSSVRLTANISPGHKLALRWIDPGQPVRRYGQVIGFATQPIASGEHVHTHNLAVGNMQPVPYLGLQDSGGVAATVEAGLREVAARLPYAD